MAAPTMTAASVEVATGRVGTLGSCSVGVMAVLESPPRARIVVTGRSAGIEWESTQDVAAQQQVMAAGAPFRVSEVAPPVGERKGSVGFAPEEQASGQGAAYPESAVVITAGGELRLDGPEIETATDMRITAWQPDDHQPVTAQAEWWPALKPRDYTDAAQVKAVHLAPGDRVVLGRAEVAVLAIEGASTDHPARVVLQILSRSGK